MCNTLDHRIMVHQQSFLRMEVFLRVACFVYCGKARTITTDESQQTRHSEALACEHDTTAWYST